jgi:RNA polymerase sigma-70 factor (ECF subfamily)
MPGTGEITQILGRVAEGDPQAYDELLPKVYAELHHLAAHYLGLERADHSLQPTELVNEAFLRLSGQTEVEWKSRAHFFAIAAQAMRRVLVDHARARQRLKRGGGVRNVPLDDSVNVAGAPPIDVLALEEALTKLEEMDPRKVQVIELLYFGGLTVQQAADVLGVTPRTVERDWRYARTWIFGQLLDGDRGSPGPQL